MRDNLPVLTLFVKWGTSTPHGQTQPKVLFYQAIYCHPFGLYWILDLDNTPIYRLIFRGLRDDDAQLL